MELLIAILMCLHLYSTPDLLDNQEFREQNADIIEHANVIIDNHWYKIDDGGVVVIDEVSQ